MSDRYWTPKQVAEKFRIDPDTVRSHLREGVWPGVKIGKGRGVWRMTQAQVDQIAFGNIDPHRPDYDRINRLLDQVA